LLRNFAVPWMCADNRLLPTKGVAMPGLIGYMLAIVITLGGYFAALNWLIRPPDPWQSSAKMPASTSQHFAARKRPPVVKPAEAANSESTAAAEPDTRLASIETSAPVAASETETTRPVEPIVQAQLPAEAPRAPVETARVARHDMSATKTRPGARKRVERNASRKLELMVLRTYERSDGKRFTRLLPMSSARSAMAFQPDDQW
jgi:hypothetical protein